MSNILRGISAGLVLVLMAALPSGPASAEAVSRIEVKGNRRIEAATIRALLPLKPGRAATPEAIDRSLKALFASGLFADVRIEPQRDRLVVTVRENPTVNQVAFEGNRKIKAEELRSAVQTKPADVLSRARVAEDVRQLLELYRRRGLSGARIEPKAIDLAENRVNLVFEIREGEKAGVLRIGFVGNKAFPDRELRDVITTRETNFLSFLRPSDVYDPDRLEFDREKLRQFYLQRGYIDVRVVSATGDYDPERKGFYVSFTLDEGPRYRFGAVDIRSDLRGADMRGLDSLLRTKSGAVFDAGLVEKSVDELALELAKRGHLFAVVNPRVLRNPRDGTASVTYDVEEGRHVYVERINVRGNTFTRDYVVRREFDLAEGDAYNKALIDRAERRLKALGFFKTVRISDEPGSAPDRVVLNVDIQEAKTGYFGWSLGYSPK